MTRNQLSKDLEEEGKQKEQTCQGLEAGKERLVRIECNGRKQTKIVVISGWWDDWLCTFSSLNLSLDEIELHSCVGESELLS